MDTKATLLSLLTLVFVWVIFFYKTIFFGNVPFAGDLLIAEYKPWRLGSYLGYQPGAYPHKAQYFDVVRELYPWRQFVVERWKSGHVPLWNPYNFSGQPLLANHQSAALYPFNILYYVTTLPIGWSIQVILQPLLTSLFTFLYARSIGLKRLTALFASISYGYCLYMSTFLEYNTMGHTIAFLPLILFAIEKIVKRKIYSYPLLITALVYTALAGHIQLYGLSIFTSVTYAGIRLFNNKKSLIYIGCCYALSMCIVAPQLFPTIELIGHAARSNHSPEDVITMLLIQPKQLLMYISQDIFGNPASRNYFFNDSYPAKSMYMGIVGLIFAVSAYFQKHKNVQLKLFLVSIPFLLLTTTRNPMSELIIKLQIPLFASSNPGNSIFLLSFLISITAGWGMQSWLHTKGNMLKYSMITLGVISTLFVLQKIHLLEVKSNAIIYAGACALLLSFAFWVRQKIERLALILSIFCIALTSADLWYHFQKFNPFVPTSLFYPQTSVGNWLLENAGYARAWGYGSAYIEANFATQMHYYSPDGTDPLYPKWYGQLINGAKNSTVLSLFDRTNRSDAQIPAGFGDDDFKSNMSRLRMMDMWSVQYFLNRVENGISPLSAYPDRFTEAEILGNWEIYNNTKATPRTYIVGQVTLASGYEKVAKILYAPSYDYHIDTIVDEKRSDLALNANTGEANIESYTPNKVQIKTSTNGKALLILTDTFYPGWIATNQNQKALDILQVNVAQRGILIDQNTSNVTLSYNPLSWNIGIYLSTLTLMLLVVIYPIYILHKNN